MDSNVDLFIIAAEPSADLHGANCIKALLHLRPNVQIAAVSGPRMRKLSIDSRFPMENLQVMGFLDVIAALPRLLRQFYTIRNTILQINPKAVLCIDYPGFNLKLARSLRKKGYRGKLIHYICPTVWAWKKGRIPIMANTLDCLLTIFPFEKKCFAATTLPVEYIGHPLVSQIPPPHASNPQPQKILALFPGSREQEVRRNFPLQIQLAKRLLDLDPTLTIAVSIAHPALEPYLRALFPNALFVPGEQNYPLMQSAYAAIATSGTVTLELALHAVPTVVHFAIRKIDLFLAQHIFRIRLPFYCIVNILLSQEVFPEYFGSHCTEEKIFTSLRKLWICPLTRHRIQTDCALLRQVLGKGNANTRAAESVLERL